ncbi:MAG: hypothetical protein QXD29_01820 [Thermoplasmata archaeon]
MARWAIIDKRNNKVINVIEAEDDFINSLTHFPDKDGNLWSVQDLLLIKTDKGSVDDIYIDGKFYREV